MINNHNLANYAMFRLNKIDNEFTEQELDKITEIVIDYDNEVDSSFVFLKELLLFKKLNSITIRNGYIYNDDYNIFLELKYLSEITFEACEFENADLIASLRLKSLSLINCNINDYTFVYTINYLEELTIVNGSVKIEQINKLSYLKYLQLSYSNIIDNVDINNNLIEELYIDNTNISNFYFLTNLIRLEKISIDENQYKNNKTLFDDLIKKNVLVLNENMVEFGGEK